MWGGLFSCFPAGWLSDRYGPKNLLFLNLLVNLAGVALTPLTAVKTGYIGMFALRCIIGAGQGMQWPAISSLMSKWFPANERTMVLGIINMGNQLSGGFWTYISAFLCRQKEFLGGWPSIFYVSGS